LIRLVNFLLYIENVSDYSKKDIDNGHTPLDIYQVCSIIRESFCCSYSIRKNNLGSDERSQALLLKKALDNINCLGKLDSQRWQKSTPGIFVKRLLNSESILENIIDLYNDKIIVIKEFEKDFMKSDIINLGELDNLMEFCYIFPFPQNSRIIEDFLGRIEGRYKIDYVNLAKIRGIENKILYVNFLIDQKENLDD